jgi:hypothetical protein
MRINASLGVPCDGPAIAQANGGKMPEIDGQDESRIREVAYFLWLNDGCPEGRADDHWMRACGMLSVSVTATGEQEVKPSTPMGDPLPDMPVAPESRSKH